MVLLQANETAAESRRAKRQIDSVSPSEELVGHVPHQVSFKSFAEQPPVDKVVKPDEPRSDYSSGVSEAVPHSVPPIKPMASTDLGATCKPKPPSKQCKAQQYRASSTNYRGVFEKGVGHKRKKQEQRQWMCK